MNKPTLNTMAGAVRSILHRDRPKVESMTGASPLASIQELSPQFGSNVIFDVGANIGQSLEEFISLVPNGSFISFEPVEASFDKLQKRFGSTSNVRLEKLALGNEDGSAIMHVDGASTGNRIIEKDSGKLNTQITPITTGDSYCRANGVERIDYLKIDTEGHDLAVLSGFRNLIAAGRIGFIQLEAGLNPTNKRHVDLQVFRGFLEPMGYYLFGIYGLTHETFLLAKGRPHILRRADVVFVSRAAAEAMTAVLQGNRSWL